MAARAADEPAGSAGPVPDHAAAEASGAGCRTVITLAEEGVEALYGTRDEHLRRIEATFGVRLSVRGQQIVIEGEDGSRRTVETLFTQQIRFCSTNRLRATSRTSTSTHGSVLL